MTEPMRIVDLSDHEHVLEQLARLSHAAAREHSPTWLPTLDDAREELRDALAPPGIARVLLGSDGAPLGWIGASHAWGRVWELHPLLIDPAHQRRGHGRRLVTDVEALVAKRGALTISVGTSDTTGATSFAGVDLYADPVAALAGLRALAPHAFGFWQCVGYVVVGVLPDADGPGRPSICMAKRVAR